MPNGSKPLPVEVDQELGCWLWLGVVDRNGYGRDRGELAHRKTWKLLRGAIPKDLPLDHVCRRRRCVRPSHLEPVRQSTNERRKRGLETRTCLREHDLHVSGRRTPEGGMVCVECNQGED